MYLYYHHSSLRAFQLFYNSTVIMLFFYSIHRSISQLTLSSGGQVRGKLSGKFSLRYVPTSLSSTPPATSSIFTEGIKTLRDTITSFRRWQQDPWVLSIIRAVDRRLINDVMCWDIPIVCLLYTIHALKHMSSWMLQQLLDLDIVHPYDVYYTIWQRYSILLSFLTRKVH